MNDGVLVRYFYLVAPGVPCAGSVHEIEFLFLPFNHIFVNDVGNELSGGLCAALGLDTPQLLILQIYSTDVTGLYVQYHSAAAQIEDSRGFTAARAPEKYVDVFSFYGFSALMPLFAQ